MREQCIGRHTLVDLNPIELNNCKFIVSLDIFNGSYNAFDDLYTKMYVPSETEDVNVKVFNMITRKNRVKTLINIFHVILYLNSIVQHVIQIKNDIMINVNASAKSIARAKKIIIGILAHIILRIAGI